MYSRNDISVVETKQFSILFTGLVSIILLLPSNTVSSLIFASLIVQKSCTVSYSNHSIIN